MKETLRQSMAWLHSWAGLPFGWLSRMPWRQAPVLLGSRHEGAPAVQAGR
ncbi:hypothetical protein ACFOGJ_05800 [Marinibaculum pumilum]|uniref:Uncharacterized protein n=1 Tax=Marinibaculum pumilum TaxID=1766165 RepID=A0ABV7KWS6_9PROT